MSEGSVCCRDAPASKNTSVTLSYFSGRLQVEFNVEDWITQTANDRESDISNKVWWSCLNCVLLLERYCYYLL